MAALKTADHELQRLRKEQGGQIWPYPGERRVYPLGTKQIYQSPPGKRWGIATENEDRR